MTIRMQDVLIYGGGECFQKFGRSVWGLNRAQRVVAPTFARSGGVGAIQGKDGVLRQAGDDRQRIVYYDLDGDGVRDTPAILLEGGSTNKILHSKDLTQAAWSSTGLSSVVINQSPVGPDGALSLERLVEDSATSEHFRHQTVTMTADVNYAFSVWVIGELHTWVRLQLDGGAGTNFARAWFNLSTGVVGTTGAGGTGAFVRAYVEDWSDASPALGLYRCVLVGSVGNADTSIRSIIALATGDNVTSYTGDGGSSILAGFAQLEEVNVATTHIDTTTVAVSRSNEDWSIGYPHDLQESTFYLKGMELGTRFLGAARPYMRIGSSTIRFSMYGLANGNLEVAHDNGPLFRSAGFSSGLPSIGQWFEFVGRLYSDGSVDAQLSVEGGSVATSARSSAATINPIDLRTLRLGSDGSGYGVTAVFAAKHVRRIHDLTEMRSLFAYDSARAVA